MDLRFERQSLLIGADATRTLASKKVALFGVGGVGSYAAEALARCGVGHIEIIDSDTVALSNINRQLCALSSTLGRYKTEVVAERLRDINPDITVTPRAEFFLPENADTFDFKSYDYVIDAIDTVVAKVEIALCCTRLGIPVISCMGTGNKLDPLSLHVTDISKTDTCPLARIMRKKLRENGVAHLKVLYSSEIPVKAQNDGGENGTRTVGSIAFVPSVAGLIAASEAVKELIGS